MKRRKHVATKCKKREGPYTNEDTKYTKLTETSVSECMTVGKMLNEDFLIPTFGKIFSNENCS